ncbi:oligosaccharide flippase family protein [uncultured Methanobrevibacter sp.]|uniref:oligosaccharide flippase family protein n=1 Tax=uncultured Methanobrevibacter sp. TaxID=253161 RepID=UPI0025D4CD1D|nr:oligosaccharide flippase family protein [uncultured Methanobrevibacter sp.]
MNQIKTIFHNMSWILISQIIASICGFIWTILIARYLGVHDYGILGFATSITGILSITTDFGISTHIVRHIATDYDSSPKYLGNAIPLKSIFAILTAILTLAILLILKCDETTIIVTLLFTLEMIIKSFINLMNGGFQAFEKGKYQGIGNTLLNAILLIFILLAIFSDWGLLGITLAYLISNIIALIYIYITFIRYVSKPHFEFDKTFCKKITMYSIPFAITGVLYSIYYSVDIIMLTNIIGNTATGIYNASYKLINVITLLYTAYTAVIFPVMSKFFKNDEKLLEISYEKSIKYLMLIMIPLAMSTMIYSTDLILLIYGPEYIDSAPTLSILIWTVCLLFVASPGNILLQASHKEVTVTKIYAIAAVFNIILNFILIPKFSFIGAAITTVVSDILIVIIQKYVIHKIGHKPNKKLYYDLIKIIVGTGILGIALYYLNLNMWIALPVGIIIYFGTVYLLRVFDDEDMFIIKEILGKN